MLKNSQNEALLVVTNGYFSTFLCMKPQKFKGDSGLCSCIGKKLNFFQLLQQQQNNLKIHQKCYNKILQTYT